jgi:CheY-like chemotaxis protein
MNIGKALVVDDSKVAHLTLRKLLTERNIEVDWVGSGEDAVAYMERQRPDVIFMDVMMPGMDGFEATAAITRNTAFVAPPIIMCSANASDEDRQNAKASGAMGFLSKPYTPADMDRVLNAVRTLPEPGGVAVPTVAEVAPPPAIPTVPAAPPSAPPRQMGFAIADMERIAERAAWSMADKVARDVATEIAETKAAQTAHAIAEQTVRALIDDVSRKAAQAAVQAAQEVSRKVAVEVAQQAAREATQESASAAARSMAEQAILDLSEDTIKKNITRGISAVREELSKNQEKQIAQAVQETLTQALTAQEFKQQLLKLINETVLPRFEKATQQAVEQSSQAALDEMGGAIKQARVALIVGSIALLTAVAAVALVFLH